MKTFLITMLVGGVYMFGAFIGAEIIPDFVGMFVYGVVDIILLEMFERG